MNDRLDNIRKQTRNSDGSGLHADLRYLLDRLLKRDRIIGSLDPERWTSIASRVPPAHREERAALGGIARIAEELRKEADEEAAREGTTADD